MGLVKQMGLVQICDKRWNVTQHHDAGSETRDEERHRSPSEQFSVALKFLQTSWWGKGKRKTHTECREVRYISFRASHISPVCSLPPPEHHALQLNHSMTPTSASLSCYSVKTQPLHTSTKGQATEVLYQAMPFFFFCDPPFSQQQPNLYPILIYSAAFKTQ